MGTRWPERQEEVMPLRTLERNRCAPPSCSLRTVPTTNHLTGGHLSIQLPICLSRALFSSGTPCQSIPQRCTHSFCSSRGASWSPWGNRRKSGNSRPWRKCLNMDYLGTAFYFQFEICPPSSTVKKTGARNPPVTVTWKRDPQISFGSCIGGLAPGCL